MKDVNLAQNSSSCSNNDGVVCVTDFIPFNLGMDDACSEYRFHLPQLAQIRGQRLCYFLLLHATLLCSPALRPDMFAPQLNQIRLYLPTENLARHIKLSRNARQIIYIHRQGEKKLGTELESNLQQEKNDKHRQISKSRMRDCKKVKKSPSKGVRVLPKSCRPLFRPVARCYGDFQDKVAFKHFFQVV